MKQENTSARLFDGFSKWDVLNYVILGVLALLCLAPVINIVAISFSSASVAEAGLVSFWPRNPTFASYERILEDRIFFGTVIVSLLRVVIGTSLSLLLLFLMAYPLSLEKEEFSKRNWYMWFVIFTMLFNGGIVPQYMIYNNYFHLKNTIWGLIIPNLLLNGFTVMLVKNYFQSSIPPELSEAMEMDGAGPFFIYRKLMLPLSKPILATVGLMSAVSYWNDWNNGLYYITDSKLYSMQQLLNEMNNNVNFLANNSSLLAGADIGHLPTATMRLAIAVVAIIPILLVYPFFQKFFAKGITMGAVKG